MSESLTATTSSSLSESDTSTTRSSSANSEAGTSATTKPNRSSSFFTTTSFPSSSVEIVNVTVSEATASPVFTTFPTSQPTPSALSPTVPSSAAPTESVNRPVSGFEQSRSGSPLSTPKIVAIAASAGALLVILIGLAVFLILRCRRSRSKRRNGAPSQNVDEETMEKYDAYAPLQYRQSSGETKVSLPFLKTSFDQSRRSSRYSGDFAQYNDLPPSPFVNGDVEITHQPLTHAVSLANATPFSQDMEEAELDVPTSLPNPHLDTRRTSPQLPPIVIPSSYKPPTRKPTTGKRVSRRGSKHTYRAIDNGEQSDVDSASMYSQPSAYTNGSDEDLTTTAVHQRALSMPLPSPGGSKHTSMASTIRPGDIARAAAPPSSSAAVAHAQDVPDVLVPMESVPSEHGTDTTGELSRENSVVVARLLKSRGRSDMPAARSGSLVSHIERKGSIRPALPRSDSSGAGARGVRALRVLRKARAREEVPPTPPSPVDGL